MSDKDFDDVLINRYINLIESYSEDIKVVDDDIIQNNSISEGVDIGDSKNVTQFVREKYFERSTDLLRVLVSAMEETGGLEDYVEKEYGRDYPHDEHQQIMEDAYGREYYEDGSFETKHAVVRFTINHPFMDVDYNFMLKGVS